MLPDTCQNYYRNVMKIDKTEFCTLITYGIGLCNVCNIIFKIMSECISDLIIARLFVFNVFLLCIL